MTEAVSVGGLSEKATVAAGVVSALLGIMIGTFAARRIVRPVNQIAAVAQKVAGGDLTEQVKVGFAGRDRPFGNGL